jgi:hypothetical protein
MRRVARWLRHPATAPLLILVLTIALPGRALFDSVLLDTFAIRLKGHVLSLAELFRADQTGLANPYYRPLFTLLHELVDRATGDSDVGQRLLTLSCHVLAAFGLLAFARALGLPRSARNLALALFLIAPGDVATAAWPLIGYWILAAALTWFAAARLVTFVRDGGVRHVAIALLLAAISLFAGETAYHLAAFAPLLALLPEKTPGARRRALLAWPLFLAVALLHYQFLEVHSHGVASDGSVSVVTRMLEEVPRYLEGGAGGNFYDGWRPLAWTLLAVAGLAALARPRLRRLALLAPLAAFPFAILGHNERYGYFAAGATALLLARALPVALARVGTPLRLARLAPLLLVAAIAFQVPARLDSVREAARVTRTMLDDLDAHRALLDDLDHVVFVNTPMPLRWAIAHRLRPRSRAEFESILDRTKMRVWLCSDSAYFAAGPADLRALGATRALVLEQGRLVERPPDRPLGDRRPVPIAFLAGGVEVVPRVSTADRGIDRDRNRDALFARLARLTDPTALALIEAPLPELSGALPQRELALQIEPLPAASANATNPAGVANPFNQQLVATVRLAQPGLFVVVTYFSAEDPIHRMTGDIGRFCEIVEAELDGAPVPIVPVDYHAAGVVVPAGNHSVRIRPRAAGASEAAAPDGR